MEFANRVAVITGAASGIGRATALAFSRAGAFAALVDLNPSGAEDVARQLQAEGHAASVYPADLSRVDQIREVFRRILADHGRVDALANVAGIYPMSAVAEVTEAHWDQVLGLDLRGVFFSCQEALKSMSAQGSGAIVNVASGAAFRPLPSMVAYASAKAGLVGMSRVLALEAAPAGVRVNVVAPGPTVEGSAGPGTGGVRDDAPRTSAPLLPGSGPELTAVVSAVGAGRWLAPDEIADAIVFLCSDRARGLQGAILHVNAGNVMP